MSQKIVNSLLFLFEHLGQSKTNIEDKIKSSYDNMKSLMQKALPDGFVAKKQPGGPFRLNRNKEEVKLNPNEKQMVQNYFWVRGEDKKIKDAPVSFSLFLYKQNNQIQVRVSVEIITAYGSEAKKSKCFSARSAYESMLNLGLNPGLFYFYDDETHTAYDENVPAEFIRSKEVQKHVEVVKLIELNDNSNDEQLLSDIKEAIRELQPYYNQATSKTGESENLQTALTASVDSKPSIAIKQTLSFPKNTILFGPPGTGKTYHSIAFAEAIVEKRQDVLDKLLSGEDIAEYAKLKNSFDKELIKTDENGKITNGHICFTTFHQSYSYEDFMEGIFPDVDKNGNIKYKLRPGVFKSLCDYAKDRLKENFVIIIDEINRGNISKIFGDLISLVEEGKRIGESNGLTATLPYSKETWGVPVNVYLIGTMNTADRSIERIDTALRRRFHFIETRPEPSLLEKYKQIAKADNTTEDLSLSELLTAMNDRIAYVFDREHQIGHSYFLTIPVDANGTYSLKELSRVFRHEIIPLLQEYFYNDYQKIRYILGLGGQTSVNGIITEKERSGFVSFNFENIDGGDDEEKVFEVNNDAFDVVDTYKKILGTNDSSAK